MISQRRVLRFDPGEGIQSRVDQQGEIQFQIDQVLLGGGGEGEFVQKWV